MLCFCFYYIIWHREHLHCKFTTFCFTIFSVAFSALTRRTHLQQNQCIRSICSCFVHFYTEKQKNNTSSSTIVSHAFTQGHTSNNMHAYYKQLCLLNVLEFFAFSNNRRVAQPRGIHYQEVLKSSHCMLLGTEFSVHDRHICYWPPS